MIKHEATRQRFECHDRHTGTYLAFLPASGEVEAPCGRVTLTPENAALLAVELWEYADCEGMPAGMRLAQAPIVEFEALERIPPNIPVEST